MHIILTYPNLSKAIFSQAPWFSIVSQVLASQMKYLIGYEMPLNSVVGIIVNFFKIFVRDAHPILVPVHLSSITNAVILFASPLAIYSVIDAE